MELPATKKPTTVQHRYKIDNHVEAYIKEFMGKNNTTKATTDNQKDNSEINPISAKYEGVLLSQIEELKGQLSQKDSQLENMQKLLD